MMQQSPRAFPDRKVLAARLSAALAGAGETAGPVRVLKREESDYASTFPSEVVTCRLADGSIKRLFCKYGAGLNHNAHGHRRGVGYEAEIYKLVLEPLGISAPRLYCAYREGPSDSHWIACEFLDDCHLLHKAPDPAAMGLAASWLGAFHALGERAAAEPAALPLTVYDADYYRGWAARTSQFATRWHASFPWLDRLCAGFADACASLLGPGQTVIHGEFYPENVLYRGQTVYPVDWESAALGAGEIDLAALTEDWPDPIARQCEAQYVLARWPSGPPAAFHQRLTTARLYLLLRWLGDRPEWTGHDQARQSIERLQNLGAQLGMI